MQHLAAPVMTGLAMEEAIRERRAQFQVVEALRCLGGVDALVESGPENIGHRNHVATVRGQAEAGHAHCFQGRQFADQIEIFMRHGLDAVYRQERLVFYCAQRHAVGIVLADEAATVLGAAVGARVIAARR